MIISNLFAMALMTIIVFLALRNKKNKVRVSEQKEVKKRVCEPEKVGTFTENTGKRITSGNVTVVQGTCLKDFDQKTLTKEIIGDWAVEFRRDNLGLMYVNLKYLLGDFDWTLDFDDDNDLSWFYSISIDELRKFFIDACNWGGDDLKEEELPDEMVFSFQTSLRIWNEREQRIEKLNVENNCEKVSVL